MPPVNTSVYFGFMLYYFGLIHDDGLLRTEIYRKVQCDIVIQISKEQFCALRL